MKYGLLGRKLGHSYSPAIHRFLGDYSYELFEREPEELEAFLRSGDFDGINVTIPYKKAVIPFLDRLDETARRLGSVNTIVRTADGKLEGHNTDFYGFSEMLRSSGLDVTGKKVLVLGTGGASVTVQAVLEDAGAEVVSISRSGANNYQNLHLHADARVIVNTTPVGMYPGNGEAPLDVDYFPHLEGVLDLIYNPARTRLMLECEQRKIPAFNGLRMLVAQAKQASEFFQHTAIDDALIDTIYRHLRCDMENTVLIGMAGCGKSTLGTLLAQKTGKTFVDADAEIEKLAGKSIPEIFAAEGEEAFRAYETQVLETLGKGSHQVIATGGGCVTKDRNYPLLHQNGTILWIKRDPQLLPTEGRPLSQKTNPTQLYKKRIPMYEAFSDVAVENCGSMEETLSKIQTRMEEC